MQQLCQAATLPSTQVLLLHCCNTARLKQALTADFAPSERPPRDAAIEGASATLFAPLSARLRPDRSKPCGVERNGRRAT